MTAMATGMRSDTGCFSMAKHDERLKLEVIQRHLLEWAGQRAPAGQTQATLILLEWLAASSA